MGSPLEGSICARVLRITNEVYERGSTAGVGMRGVDRRPGLGTGVPEGLCDSPSCLAPVPFPEG